MSWERFFIVCPGVLGDERVCLGRELVSGGGEHQAAGDPRVRRAAGSLRLHPGTPTRRLTEGR